MCAETNVLSVFDAAVSLWVNVLDSEHGTGRRSLVLTGRRDSVSIARNHLLIWISDESGASAAGFKAHIVSAVHAAISSVGKCSLKLLV